MSTSPSSCQPPPMVLMDQIKAKIRSLTFEDQSSRPEIISFEEASELRNELSREKMKHAETLTKLHDTEVKLHKALGQQQQPQALPAPTIPLGFGSPPVDPKVQELEAALSQKEKELTHVSEHLIPQLGERIENLEVALDVKNKEIEMLRGVFQQSLDDSDSVRMKMEANAKEFEKGIAMYKEELEMTRVQSLDHVNALLIEAHGYRQTIEKMKKEHLEELVKAKMEAEAKAFAQLYPGSSKPTLAQARQRAWAQIPKLPAPGTPDMTYLSS